MDDNSNLNSVLLPLIGQNTKIHHIHIVIKISIMKIISSPKISMLLMISIIVSCCFPVVAAQVVEQKPAPDTNPQGLSYGEWAAKWWQWVYSIPQDENPLYDETGTKCAVKQTGSVWFLVGTFGGSITRECTIPSNTSLFFPLINTECSIAGGDGKTEEELKRCATANIDRTIGMDLMIDGKKVENLGDYRAQSQLYNITLPANNIMGVSPQTTSSIAEGYWIFLNPLSAGKHEIKFGGQAGDLTVASNMNFATQSIYHLTIK
jgi:hypothetical protein